MDENLKNKITDNKENIQPHVKMTSYEKQEYERQKRKREGDSDHDEMQYLNLIRHIINNGALKGDRTGINIYTFSPNSMTYKFNFLNMKKSSVLIIILIQPGEYVKKLQLIFCRERETLLNKGLYLSFYETRLQGKRKKKKNQNQ